MKRNIFFLIISPKQWKKEDSPVDSDSCRMDGTNTRTLLKLVDIRTKKKSKIALNLFKFRKYESWEQKDAQGRRKIFKLYPKCNVQWTMLCSLFTIIYSETERKSITCLILKCFRIVILATRSTLAKWQGNRLFCERCAIVQYSSVNMNKYIGWCDISQFFFLSCPMPCA